MQIHIYYFRGDVFMVPEGARLAFVNTLPQSERRGIVGLSVLATHVSGRTLERFRDLSWTRLPFDEAVQNPALFPLLSLDDAG